MRLYLSHGARIPRGYGFAWRLYDRDQALYLPLGINVIASGARSIWHWLKAGFQPSVLDRIYDVAYQAGKNDERRRHEDRLDRIENKLARLK